MTGTVLVTGGFGLVGSATVRRLTDLGRRVVAADLDTPANRKKAAKLPEGAEARWADLTDPDQVPPGFRHRSRGDHSPRRGHRAGDLSHPQGGATNQRGRHGNLGSYR